LKILGIGGLLGHDANAALVMNGRIIFAAQEERYTRIKHDYLFPINAINDCLDAGNITYEDIDIVVLAEKPFQVYLNNRLGCLSNRMVNRLGNSGIVKKLTSAFFEKDIARLFPNATVKYSWHHFSHAISSYYSSDFDQAVFLCIDGKGEAANASIGFIDDQEAILTHELPYANGLGMLYTLITRFLGFPSFGSEYKVMGLAPYGSPKYVERIKLLYSAQGNGAIRLSRESTFHPGDLDKLMPWVTEIMGVNQRQANEEIADVHTDIAASLQAVFEEVVLEMAVFAKKLFNTPNLLFCGGCAQNCVTAGKLRDSKLFDNVYNSPVGGDMGSGLGAALAYLHKSKMADRKLLDFKGYYLGSTPGKVTNPVADEFMVKSGQADLFEVMARHLADGKIIGWIHDGMELGARALGARSIIANPLIPGIQTDLNLKIKFRESFRPFAPAILSEDVNEWFEIDQPADFMQYTAYLKKGLRHVTPETFASFKEQLNYPRCAIPSVVHVDYSARLQTISADVHPAFYKLLQAFKKITGVPILINTSFNVNGQPIVRTADEAWECFINTDIDLLVVEDTMYRNPFDKTKKQKLEWLKQFENYSR
jgi:carbamoyltransferase